MPPTNSWGVQPSICCRQVRTPTMEVVLDQLRETKGLRKFRLTLLHKGGEQLKVQTWAIREAEAFGPPMIFAGWTPAEVLDAWKQKHPALR